MASELVPSIRRGAMIDGSLKESVRAAMRTRIRCLLAKYDYSPDLEERAWSLFLSRRRLFASEREARLD
jgi:type I restriction enzyme R subunit